MFKHGFERETRDAHFQLGNCVSGSDLLRLGGKSNRSSVSDFCLLSFGLVPLGYEVTKFAADIINCSHVMHCMWRYNTVL